MCLLWSSFSVQSADQHTQANSSGEKEQISPSIWNLNGGPTKQTAGIALCTCRKQLILIPLHLGGSFGLVSAAHRDEGQGRKDAAGLFGIFFSCDPGDAGPLFFWQQEKPAHSAIIKSTRQRWSEEEVISYCARPYTLTSSFSSDALSFYEVQKLCG